MLASRFGFARNSRPRKRGAAAVLAIVLLAVACQAGQVPSPPSSPGPAETTAVPGDTTPAVVAPEIPSDTVRLGLYPCCPDQNFILVPIRKGFFSDLGITLDPPEGIQVTASDQSEPLLVRGDVDIMHWYVPRNLQMLDTNAYDIVPIMMMDIFLGIFVLKAPDAVNPAKTTKDYLAEGKTFQEAAALAVEQLRGEEIYTPAEATTLPLYVNIFLSYADDLSSDDIQFKLLGDPEIAQQGAAGRIQWAIPVSAGIQVQLLRNGWEPLIDATTVFENDPGSEQRTQLASIVGSSGQSAQRSFVEEHHETTLRFLSAVYRAIDFTFDPETKDEALKIVADSVNATQGSDLTPEEVEQAYLEIDPFFPWKDQGRFVWDEGAPYSARESTKATLEDLITRGFLPDQEYDLDEYLVAEQLYLEMKDLQQQADELLQQAASASLTPEQQSLVEQAQQYYDWYDFLDAVRFLDAALD